MTETSILRPDHSKGQIEGELKFQHGDTAIYYTMQETGLASNSDEMRKLRADYTYSYFPREMHSIRYFPSLVKYLDPSRLLCLKKRALANGCVCVWEKRICWQRKLPVVKVISTRLLNISM